MYWPSAHRQDGLPGEQPDLIAGERHRRPRLGLSNHQLGGRRTELHGRTRRTFYPDIFYPDMFGFNQMSGFCQIRLALSRRER
jgi:hypothetical protein